MITILIALWVTRKVNEMPILNGVLVGLVAAALDQVIIHFLYPPVSLAEMSTYFTLGVAGGWLGGIEGRKVLAGQEALYRASRRIATTRDPHVVAKAIGECLGKPDANGVTLWRIASEGDHFRGSFSHTFDLLASWTLREDLWPPGVTFEPTMVPTLDRLCDKQFAMLHIGDLPAADNAAWKRWGIRSAFVIPLLTPAETQIGLLIATFRKKHRFSKGAMRQYLTISGQAALALENIRLVEEARMTGRETGVLLERQRLSHEIHDTLAQGFTSIVMNLTAVKLSSQQLAGATLRYLEDAQHTARKNLAEARRVVWALRPESLDRHPLPEAIKELVQEWSEASGVETHYVVTGMPRSLRPETEVMLLRVAQEALSNIRKHSGAERAAITLSYMDEIITLDIKDDGIGFTPTGFVDQADPHTMGSWNTGGFGLTAMRERAEQLGGALVIESAPDTGTTLMVELPLLSDMPQAKKIEKT